MRALRSRNVENAPTVSDGRKSLSKITQKKTRSRRMKLSLSNDSVESSDNDNNASKAKISIISNEEQVTLEKNIQIGSRKSKRIKKVSSEDEGIFENSKTLCVEENNEENNIKYKSTLKKNTNLRIRSTTRNMKSFNIESLVNNTISSEDNLKNTSKRNSTKLCRSRSTSLNATNSSKKFSRLGDNKNFSDLANQVTEPFSNNIDSENMPEELLKMETSSSGESVKMTCNNNQTYIIVDDSLNSYNHIVKAKEATIENTTFNKSNTFEILNTSIIEKSNFGESSPRGTYEIKNTSGPWSVIDISNESQNMSVEKITLHKKPKSDTNVLNTTFDTPNKSIRKKWIKFQTTEVQSPILRKSLFNDSSKSIKKIHSSTPFVKNITSTKPKRLSNTFKKNNSIMKKTSTTKSDQNRTPHSSKKNNSHITINSNMKSNRSIAKAKPMPNFTLIHQKASEKQESIKDYSQRKNERAQKLLSGEKPENDKDLPKSNVVKSSQALFGDIQSNKNVIKTPLQINTSQTNKKEKVIKKKEFVSKLQLPKSYNTNPQNILMNKENNVLSANNVKINKSGIIKLPLSSTKVDITSNKQAIVKPYAKPPTILTKPHFTFKPSTMKEEAKKDDKPVSVFSKGNYMAIANKTKTADKLSNRGNRRDQIKGVRTNRRFELLMKMRNNN